MVHLLEERGQVLGLGDGDVVAELEQARLVLAPLRLGRARVRASVVEGLLHDGEEPQLFGHDAGRLFVVLEPEDDVVYDGGAGGHGIG